MKAISFIPFTLCCMLFSLPLTASIIIDPTIPQWDGNDYDHNSESQYQWAWQALNHINLTNYSCILDLGCGIGKVTQEIARRLPHATVVGCDVSASMIATAQKKYSNQPNVTYAVYDAHELPAEYTHKFDCIVSTNAFHWMKNHQLVFNNIARCLKPGGIVLIDTSSAVGEDTSTPTIKALLHVAQSPRWRPYFKNSLKTQEEFYGLDVTAVEKMLKKASLTLITLKKDITLATTFANKAALANWLKPIAEAYPSFAQLSADKKDSFMKDVVEEYLRLVPANPDGTVTYSLHDNALVIARK